MLRFATDDAWWARGPARAAVLLGSAFLLLTYGGAIFAAPLSLPLLAWTARATPSPRIRALAGVLAGLTAAEVGWAITYVVAGEDPLDRPASGPGGPDRRHCRLPPGSPMTRPSRLGLASGSPPPRCAPTVGGRPPAKS